MHTKERSSPGFLLPKLSFSFPQLPLAQRIFVEDVETGSKMHLQRITKACPWRCLGGAGWRSPR